MGFAWIQYKVEKDFTSEKNAQKAMDTSVIPGILGPDGAIYIVDDHHTSCALDFSGFASTTVTMNIICDKRNTDIDTFWDYLSTHNLAYLAAHPNEQPNKLPLQITYSDLPKTFSFTTSETTFNDDPWRAMAAFSRKVTSAPAPAPSCSSSDNKYCERCMYRGCVDGYQQSGTGVAFFEFRWAYFMNDATYFSTSFWPSESARSDFQAAYEALGDVMGKYDTSQWLTTAALVVSLCRAETSSQYVLPVSLFPLTYSTTSTLPGYYDGYVKLAGDPDCDAPICS